jgi:hypothetical protein
MYKIKTCIVGFSILLFIKVNAQVISYGDIYMSEPSNVFSVKVNGQQVFTHSFMSYDYSHFSFSGSAKVEVTFNEPITKGVTVTPSKYNIRPVVSGNKFSFTLDAPRKLFIRVNVADASDYWASANDHHFLVIFADAIEKNVPRPGAKNVISVLDYGADKTGAVPSENAIMEAIDACPSKGTVIFPAGKYLLNSSVSIRKPNITIYLDGGAFIQRNNGSGALVAAADGLTIKGMGTVEARSYPLITGPRAINDFRLEGIILRDSYISVNGDYHMIASLYLNNFNITNIKGLGCPQNDTYKKQRDGIAIRDSKNGVVDNIFVWSGDDAFYVTAGRYTAKGSKQQEGSETRNILVKDCLFRAEGGASAMKDMATLPITNLKYLDCVSLRGALQVDSRAESGVQKKIVFKNIDIEELSHVGISKLFGTEYMDAPIDVRFENNTYKTIWPGKSRFIIRAGNRVKVEYKNLRVGDQVILSRDQLEKSGFRVTWEGDPVVSFEK